jgi:hypothetical protein
LTVFPLIILLAMPPAKPPAKPVAAPLLRKDPNSLFTSTMSKGSGISISVMGTLKLKNSVI